MMFPTPFFIITVLLSILVSGCEFTNQTVALPSTLVSPTPTPTASPTSTSLPFSVTSITPSTASESILTAVEIQGTGFDELSTVSIGGNPCLGVTVVSSTVIQCSIQISKWGFYSVSVTNSNNETTLPLIKGFQVTALPPSITSITSPAEGPSSGGTNFLVLGSHFQSGSVVTLDGFTCLSASVTPPYLINCITPPHTPAVVDVTVTNPDGQSETLDDAFTYLPTPIAPSNFTYSTNPAWYPLSSTPITALSPTYSGSIATGFTVSPSLPAGFTLDATTGVITGTPTTATSIRNYSVTLTNRAGSTTTTLSLGVMDVGSGTSDFTSSVASETLNKYARITTATPSGTSLPISSTTGFLASDRVLILQTRASNSTFNWEIAQISSSWNGNSPLELTSSLTKTYTSNAAGAITQVVTLPQYRNVTIQSGHTITADAWDGNTGGVIAFEANGTVTVDGSINASGKGFTGGAAGIPNSDGKNGESFTGTEATTTDGAGQGGDGSGAAALFLRLWAVAGGGGGYGTAGQKGLGKEDGTYAPDYSGTDYNGGGGAAFTLGTANLSRLFLGPGGGGGSRNTLETCTPQAGAPGGGIILIFAHQIAVGSSGSISANGQNVLQNDNCTGGAGAGGSIYLKAATMQLGANQVSATGGTTVTISTHAQGGAGGNGRIRIDFGAATGTPNPVPGHIGTP